jgi:hypothetical protein
VASHDEYLVQQSKNVYADFSVQETLQAGIDLGLGSIFDLFSVPAWFTLLERCLSSEIDARDDLDLLRKVSAAFSLHASRMVTGHFHSKVALVLEMTIRLVTENLDLLRSTTGEPDMVSQATSLDSMGDTSWMFDASALDWAEGSIAHDSLFGTPSQSSAVQADDNITVMPRKRLRTNEDDMADIFAFQDGLMDMGRPACPT